MPVAHRRQRARRDGEAGQRSQRQIDVERVTVEWIDFNAKDFAAENLAKGFNAVVTSKGSGGDPERLHFVVGHALSTLVTSRPAPICRMVARSGSNGERRTTSFPKFNEIENRDGDPYARNAIANASCAVSPKLCLRQIEGNDEIRSQAAPE
jgi:hypothetical protein